MISCNLNTSIKCEFISSNFLRFTSFTSTPQFVLFDIKILPFRPICIKFKFFVYFKANLCHPNPCLNSGQCMDVGGIYSCVCTPQYKGKHCEGKSVKLDIPGSDNIFNICKQTVNLLTVTVWSILAHKKFHPERLG